MRASLGAPALDELLGGGIPAGAAVLVAARPSVDAVGISAGFLSDGLGNLDGGLVVQTTTGTNVREHLAQTDPHLPEHEDEERVRYVATPETARALALPAARTELVATVRDLNALTAAINRAQQALSGTGSRRIVVDDLGALLETTNRETVTRFLQVLVGRIYRAQDAALVLSRLDPDDPVLDRLHQGFDAVIDLTSTEGRLEARLVRRGQGRGQAEPVGGGHAQPGAAESLQGDV